VCECCVSVLHCQLLTLLERKVISYIERPSLHREVNTLHLGYKTSQLTLYREVIALCPKIPAKRILYVGIT